MNTDSGHARDRWLISYADLVTLLLGLFIVLYAASDKQRAEAIAQSFSANGPDGSGVLNGRTSSNTEALPSGHELLNNDLLMRKASVRRSGDGIVISLSEAGFFPPGDSDVSPEAVSVVRAVVETLRSSSASIRIEGHTDSTPIATSKYPSNWELSTARASSVLSSMITEGIDPARLSAAGYAGFRPIESNSTPEGRAQNRRVDIVILSPK